MSEISKMIETIRKATPEERAALSEAMKDLEPKPEPEARILGEAMRDPRYLKENGEYMTAEERYDRDHPLTGFWCYGNSTLIQTIGQSTKKRYYTNAEVDAHNEEIINAWYEAKRKKFPNCLRPVHKTKTIET